MVPLEVLCPREIKILQKNSRLTQFPRDFLVMTGNKTKLVELSKNPGALQTWKCRGQPQISLSWAQSYFTSISSWWHIFFFIQKMTAETKFKDFISSIGNNILLMLQVQLLKCNWILACDIRLDSQFLTTGNGRQNNYHMYGGSRKNEW